MSDGPPKIYEFPSLSHSQNIKECFGLMNVKWSSFLVWKTETCVLRFTKSETWKEKEEECEIGIVHNRLVLCDLVWKPSMWLIRR